MYSTAMLGQVLQQGRGVCLTRADVGWLVLAAGQGSW